MRLRLQIQFQANGCQADFFFASAKRRFISGANSVNGLCQTGNQHCTRLLASEGVHHSSSHLGIRYTDSVSVCSEEKVSGNFKASRRRIGILRLHQFRGYGSSVLSSRLGPDGRETRSGWLTATMKIIYKTVKKKHECCGETACKGVPAGHSGRLRHVQQTIRGGFRFSHFHSS